MAIGFTPRYTTDIPFDGLTPEQFLALVYNTVISMNWRVIHLGTRGLIAYKPSELFSKESEMTVKIGEETAVVTSHSPGSIMTDLGNNKKNVEAFLARLAETKEASAAGVLDETYHALQQHMVAPKQDHLLLPPPTRKEKIRGFLSYFIPEGDFFVTPVLLDLNILIFIIMAAGGMNILSPGSETLLAWGANFRPLTLDGQWWRLLTCCFIHIGIIHLLLNMYALAYIGIMLEPLLGRTRFIAAYLLTGVAASITSLWWHDWTVSAGASGAIFGMYGVFLALLTTNLIEKTARQELLSSIAVFVGYNLIFGLKGGIDNAAHIGGLVSGMIMGYIMAPGLMAAGRGYKMIATIAVMVVITLVPTAFVYKSIPNDIGKYDEQMKRFSSMEALALEVYNLPENTPDEKVLYTIKDIGIYYWQENILLLDSIATLDLPAGLRKRNELLKEYCGLRIKSYNLLYKTVSEQTEQYNNELKAVNAEIEAKIAEIGGNK
jgi:rhomboid protease GluP